MTYPRLVLTTWLLALLLALLLAYDLAHAEGWYLDVGAGVTKFSCTICSSDGTWIQTGLPHDMTMTSFAYRAGAGYRWQAWSVQASYVNLGVAKIRQHYTVVDEQYNPKAHSCLAPCTNLGPFHTHDLMEGAELTASYTWRHWPIQPYVKLGAAGLYHRLTAQWTDASGMSQAGTMHGWVPSAVLGGGLEYGWLYAEGSYYRGIGGSVDWSAGLPISKEQVVGFAGIRIPLTWR